jgi:hypothetical protein
MNQHSLLHNSQFFLLSAEGTFYVSSKGSGSSVCGSVDDACRDFQYILSTTRSIPVNFILQPDSSGKFEFDLLISSTFINQQSVTISSDESIPNNIVMKVIQKSSVFLTTVINVVFNHLYFSIEGENKEERNVPFIINEEGILNFVECELHLFVVQSCGVISIHSITIFNNFKVSSDVVCSGSVIVISSLAKDVTMTNFTVTSYKRNYTSGRDGGVISCCLGHNGNLIILNSTFENCMCGVFGEDNTIVMEGGKGGAIYCEMISTTSKFSINNGTGSETIFSNCKVSRSSINPGLGAAVYLSVPKNASNSCYFFGNSILFTNCEATAGNHFFISAHILNQVILFFINFL